MRILAILASAAMLVSLFLPWFTAAIPGLSNNFAPWDILREIEFSGESLGNLVDTFPLEILLLLATFPLAALFLILALIGLPSRLLAVLAGGLACGVVGWGVWRGMEATGGAMDVLGDAAPDLQTILSMVSDQIGAGGWAWGGGAVLLLLTGIVGFGRGRYRA